MKIIYAGDRDISVEILNYLIENDIKPLALFVSDKNSETHAKELINLCSYLDSSYIFEGNNFHSPDCAKLIKSLNSDFILGVHFPYIIPENILKIPKKGVLNLHPAYLPYNKGWHTPSWAIFNEDYYGATLHFMSEELDSGDIVLQRKIQILASDTADTLYKKVKKLEFELFKEALPSLLNGSYSRKSQTKKGTKHKKEDLENIRKLNLNKSISTSNLLKQLRALTTSDIKEASYFMLDGEKYLVSVNIVRETEIE